jgi:hypothetical protein
MSLLSTIGAASSKAWGFARSAVSALLNDPYFKYVTLLLSSSAISGTPSQNSTFLDSSTNDFAITTNGNTTQGSFSPYGNLWSNYLNGSSGYLDVAFSSGLQFGSGNWTVECWVNPAPIGSWQTIFSTINANPAFTGYSLAINPSGYVDFIAQVGGSITGHITATNNSIQANVWTHIAVTYNGTTSVIYVNGVACTSTITTVFSAVTTNTDLIIGYQVATGYPYPLTGYVSNLRLTNTVVYASAFTPPTTPLTAISGTALLTCQSNRFIDNSSTAASITTSGSPSVQRFSPFNPTSAYNPATIGGSGYFDGSSTLGIAASSAFAFGTNDFTVECWYYSSNVANPAYFAFNETTADTDNWGFFINGSGQLQFSSYTLNYLTVTSGLISNQWNHVAVTRSGSTLSIYSNGVQRGTASNSANFSDVNPLTIGTSAVGYFTDTRIVNGTALYTGSTYTIPTSPESAVSGTQLLINYTNAGIPDSAEMNDLQTVGSAQSTTSVVKYGNSSLSFDGSTSYLYSVNNPPLYLTSSTPFTIEGWVYFNVIAEQYVLSNWIAASNGYAIATGVSSFANNQLCFFDGNIWRACTSTVSSGTWYHFAVSSSGTASGTYLYLNGVSQIAGFTCSSLINNTTSPFFVGSYTTSGSESLNGYLSDVRITNGYNRYPNGTTFTPPTAALPNY